MVVAAPLRAGWGCVVTVPRAEAGRLAAFAAVVVLVVVGTVAYLRHARNDAARAAPSVSTTPAARIGAGPRIVFRNENPAHYGVLGEVALADPGGARALLATKCERMYAAASRVLCVSLSRLSVLYRAEVLVPVSPSGTAGALRNEHTLRFTGIPSRARLSADGQLAATTSFAAFGDSYVSTDFSTRTYITDLRPGATDAKGSSLESFTLLRNNRAIAPVDRNYWGVTFARDDNTFFATVAFGGRTYLVRGDLRRRATTIVRADAECPSLSPDGRHLVYKKRDGMSRGHWRLTTLDLASGRETPLAETRSVDDQVEWLDNGRVLYAIARSGRGNAIDDIWSVPADGTGAPHLLIAQASSPAVLR
jgi:hypothetical protein